MGISSESVDRVNEASTRLGVVTIGRIYAKLRRFGNPFTLRRLAKTLEAPSQVRAYHSRKCRRAT
jgi:hypothetical protein